MSRRLTAAIAGALVAMLLAGCSGSKAHTPARTTSTTATGAAGLEPLLISDVPAGAVRQPDAKADTGPTDLDKAAKGENSPDGRDLLTRAKFVAGYQRVWTSTGGGQIVDYLYKFAGADGANTYLAARKARLLDTTPINGQPRPQPAPFDVAGIPGATGVTTKAATFSSAVIIFAKGPYVVQLVVDDNTGTDQHELAASLAFQQFGKLPA